MGLGLGNRRQGASLEAAKQSGAPQACAAGYGTDVAVLFEIFELRVVTQGDAAIVAKGKIVL